MRVTHTCHFSNETIDFLLLEIEDILENCNLEGKAFEEIKNFGDALNVAKDIHLSLEAPPYDGPEAAE